MNFTSVVFLFGFGVIFMGNLAAAADLPTFPVAALPVPTEGAAPLMASPVDYKRFRDPFKEPMVSDIQEIRSDLERFAVTDFKVVAIITGPIRMRAMIVAPDSKTHTVSEKTKLGLRDGVITKITTKTIVVREKVVNPLGEIEFFDTEIGLDPPSVAGNPTQ